MSNMIKTAKHSLTVVHRCDKRAMAMCATVMTFTVLIYGSETESIIREHTTDFTGLHWKVHRS